MVRRIRTEKAPTPGAYSQAVVIDPMLYDLVFLAGQTGNMPDTKDELLVGEEVYAQTMRTLWNIVAVVKAAGGAVSDIVDLKVYLKDSEDVGEQRHKARIFAGAEFSRAFVHFFSLHKQTEKDNNLPARTLMWVAALPALTQNTLVEISAIAAVPKRRVR